MPSYIDTIICEDIRAEIGNKVTLAGVFGEELIVPVVPIAMASLAFIQRWRLSSQEIAAGPGQFTFGMEYPDRTLERYPPQQLNPVQKGITITSLSFALKFQGFPVRLKGEYKFKTFINNVEMYSYSFYIFTHADLQAAQAAQVKSIGFAKPS